jgi:hypothetical protein
MVAHAFLLNHGRSSPAAPGVTENQVLRRLESRKIKSCGAWSHGRSSPAAPGVTEDQVLRRLESRKIKYHSFRRCVFTVTSSRFAQLVICDERWSVIHRHISHLVRRRRFVSERSIIYVGSPAQHNSNNYIYCHQEPKGGGQATGDGSTILFTIRYHTDN